MKLLAQLLLLAGLVSGIFAQTPSPDPELEKKAARRAKLIAAIDGDAAQLKLPENRAIINARIGAVIWSTDAELGRKLFRTAVNDLIAAQQFAEASKNPAQFHELLNGQSLRPQILNLIADREPEFALESLYKTRPANVERSLAGVSPNGKIDGRGGHNYYAQSEINLEQRLLHLNAAARPEKYSAMLKDGIRKRISGETLGLLKTLHAKEPATANELANEVVGRLNGQDFFKDNQPNHEMLNVSSSIIAEFLREKVENEKYIALDESRIRQLSQKVIATYLSYGDRIGYVPMEQLEPMIKRFSPASYEPLRKVVNSPNNRRHHWGSPDPEFKKLMDGNPTADALVTAAKNFPVATQQSIYQNAANKFSENGQYQNAVALLNDKMEGDALENAVSSLNWYYAHHLIQKGQYDAAESLMLEFNDSNRNSALISLATTVYNANKEENRTRAVGILNRIRGLMPDRAENSNDMSHFFALINAMAAIEPAEAFLLFDSVIDQLNQLTEAYAVVNAFQGGNIRQGEYLLANGFNFGVYIDPNMLNTLAQKDPERANAIIDSFARREVRILMRLNLLGSGY